MLSSLGDTRTTAVNALTKANNTFWSTNGNVQFTNNDVAIGSSTSESFKLKVQGNMNVVGSVNCTGSFTVNGNAFAGASQWISNGSTIYYSTGTVGINTSTPQTFYKLDVNGNSRFADDINFDISGKGIAWSGNNDAAKIFYESTSENDSKLVISTLNDFLEPIVFRISGSEIARFQWYAQSGNATSGEPLPGLAMVQNSGITWHGGYGNGGGPNDWARIWFSGNDDTGGVGALFLEIKDDPLDAIIMKAAGTERFRLNSTGITVTGTFSKPGGTFDIPHPIVEGKNLRHSFIEGPRADLIYRNRVTLVGGKAQVNLNRESTGNGQQMSDGTFEALCRNPDVFLQNITSWDRVRGHVQGCILHIESEDAASTSEISWMVVAERCDPTIKTLSMTDDEGFVVLEYQA